TATALVMVANVPLVNETLNVTVAEAAGARVPRLQMMGLAVASQLPWLGIGVLKVTPLGRESVSVTPVAGKGPLLTTVILYVTTVNVVPITLLVVSCMETARSAVVAPPGLT